MTRDVDIYKALASYIQDALNVMPAMPGVSKDLSVESASDSLGREKYGINLLQMPTPPSELRYRLGGRTRNYQFLISSTQEKIESDDELIKQATLIQDIMDAVINRFDGGAGVHPDLPANVRLRRVAPLGNGNLVKENDKIVGYSADIVFNLKL